MKKKEKKIYHELVMIRKELQTIRRRLEFNNKKLDPFTPKYLNKNAIPDGVRKAVQSAIHDTDIKAEL